MEVVLFFVVVVGVLWALPLFLGRWQLSKNQRHYEFEVVADPSAVLATAATALKGRNPLAAVETSSGVAERTIEKRYSAGPMQGQGCVATARVEVHRKDAQRCMEVARNSFVADTLLGVPAKASATAGTRRAVERVRRALESPLSAEAGRLG